MKKHLLIAGGDARTPYIGEILKNHNFEITLYGFEKYPLLPLELNITNHPTWSDILLLPIPCTKDNITLNAPYTMQPISWQTLIRRCEPKLIFGGNLSESVITYLNQNNIPFFDYAKSPEFAIKNALPTAEGTIEIIMKNSPYVIENAKVCVVGFGRIGKVLAQKLQALGCKVTVTARKEEQLTEIQKMGCTPLHTKDLENSENFDSIINTVPALVVDRKVLKNQRKDTLIIDLASKPGGVDFAYAQEKGIKTIHALSLPAKYAPKTAGAIIAETILEYLHETE